MAVKASDQPYGTGRASVEHYRKPDHHLARYLPEKLKKDTLTFRSAHRLSRERAGPRLAEAHDSRYGVNGQLELNLIELLTRVVSPSRVR